MSAFTRRRFIIGSAAILGTACVRRAGSKLETIAGEDASAAGARVATIAPSHDVFGYGEAFDSALKRIGQISPAELVQRYAPAVYLPKLSWNATDAKFYSKFHKAPAFQLDANELAAFQHNGFVVSERLGAASFAELYYRVFTHDLPVFISADSVLHAWHRSYDGILEELEETYLSTSLDELLEGMANALPAAHKAYGKGVLADSVADADYFITVARSLRAGKPTASALGGGTQAIGNTLAAVKSEKMQSFELFGRARKMDYSQFKVRGHYENSENLKRYFRAMMWLGRIDLRVSGDDEAEDYTRQLGSAVVLHDLLKRSNGFTQWEQFDRLLQTFVGRTDSMTFAQLSGILKSGGLDSPAKITDMSMLDALQAKIAGGKIGAQQIRSAYFESSPLGPDKASLPHSFTVMGQKFAVDSWATSKIVADDIMWNGGKVQRRMPSALDIAFGVLGNDQVTPNIAKRIENTNGVAFRDGLPYQHNLAAVRAVVDSHPRQAWSENLYMGWLATLRALSAPTTDKKYPEAMRTRAWAMKTVNTQLSSWSQLRHDTILYVKQSYTSGVSCFHPAGLVEPRPDFWDTFAQMARRAVKLIDDTPYPKRTINNVDLRALQKKHSLFLEGFSKHLDQLHSIAEKQLACSKLTEAEAHILEDVIQISHGSGFTHYSGWYPTLFYKGPKDSGKYDALIADVHTDVPAPMLGDPGGVLHQGVGQVDMMMLAVEHGTNRIAYAGPTMSHYELATTGVTRKSDTDWKKQLKDGKAPDRPEWTSDYLIPGKNPRAKYYE